MAAFDRIASGIPEMDVALDNIRLGDNVVWRVASLDEFQLFLDPYVRQAVQDHRDIYYIRFASHRPLVEGIPEVKTIHVELTRQIEAFTVEIHNIIEEAGRDAFFVFDCLSELQTAWSTDLMMGNFFHVTCPYLFSLDTVAFFPLIRGKHSFSAIAKIRDTAQVLLDVYSSEGNIYVRPEKMWHRYSETMFLPHQFEPDSLHFRPILDGVQASRFYSVLNDEQGLGNEHNRDYWDRYFSMTRTMYDNGMDVRSQCDTLCWMMMTPEEEIRSLILSEFSPEDYFHVRSKMIGTGWIGGKACGMLLARKILQNHRPDLYRYLEPHDSFYVGSDVFYSYIVDNGFWELRVRQKKEEEYFSLSNLLQEKFMSGIFTRDMEEQFCRILEYYGQDPIIVRSSSILEDGFGNAFAGKYESVFCSNVGSLEERLQELENAIRVVYASTMSLSALDYRKRRGLDLHDEQMALLIQRVSGSHYDEFYMPGAAGVGYSYSPYRFVEDIDPSAGMLRLVMGLGTSAVDREEGSYPRLVCLDKPEATPLTTVSERHQFSQQTFELINKDKRQLERLRLNRFEKKMPPHLKAMLLEHDYDVERQIREQGHRDDVLFISCAGLVKKNDLMEMMKELLSTLQAVYSYPVDIEYTINISEGGEYTVNLLQCRPLQVFKDSRQEEMPSQLPEDHIFLECSGASMGMSQQEKIDEIVWVDPIAYYEMPYNRKAEVARAIGAINWHYRGQGKHMLLLVPGRIGTSSPELGVPTTFADISEFDAVCEVAEDRAGYRPELSYGSHIFQDLVESQILYAAVFRDLSTPHYHPEMITSMKNDLLEIYPQGEGLEKIIGLFHVSGCDCHLYHDMNRQHLIVTLSENTN